MAPQARSCRTFKLPDAPLSFKPQPGARNLSSHRPGNPVTFEEDMS